MEKFQLNCVKREKLGTSFAKKDRRAGFIVGVVYSKDLSLPIQFKRDEFLKILHIHPAIENVIIELSISGNKKNESYPTIVKEVQYDPVDDSIIHIDFKKISLEEKIQVRVPVVPKGEAAGIKNGGTVEYITREIEVECLPQDIPGKIEVDISALDIGHSIHVSEISIPESVEVLDAPEQVLFTCVAHVEEVVEEVTPEEAEAAAPAEPEVIKEKKKEKEEEEEPQES